jgi:hypothetical protein
LFNTKGKASVETICLSSTLKKNGRLTIEIAKKNYLVAGCQISEAYLTKRNNEDALKPS